MSFLCFYLQAHQPRRLKKTPVVAAPFDDALERQILNRVTRDSYLPVNHLLAELVRRNSDFHICLGVSGVLLEQARRFQPRLLKSFEALGRVARDTGRIEVLAETSYHSMSSLFKDMGKEEFKQQVKEHCELISNVFGIKPTAMANTELMFNNSIAAAAAELGFEAVLCERRGDMVGGNSPNAIFFDRSRKIKVIPRNPGLSDEIALHFANRHITADDFSSWVARVDGEAVMVGMDYEAIGQLQPGESGIFDFWRRLPAAIAEYPNVKIANPTEIARQVDNPPIGEVDDLATSAWGDKEANTVPWLGTPAQAELFLKYQELEPMVKAAGDPNLLEAWRHLGSSDHFHFMMPASQRVGMVAARESHFADASMAVMAYTSLVTELRVELGGAKRSVQIKRKARRPRILLVTPEVTELPAGFGNLANYVQAKGGGLADISAALVAELLRLGLDVHVALPKYERQMLEKSRVSQSELDRMAALFGTSEPIHLAQDSAFAYVREVYERMGVNTALHRAVAFQRAVINQIFAAAAPEHGKMIVHCNDWMTGLIPAAAKARGFPSLFTVHNVHTDWDRLSNLERCGIDVARFWKDLCLFDSGHNFETGNWEEAHVDFLLSGVKAANHVNTVSPSFLLEVVNGYFPDTIEERIRYQISRKYQENCASGILNAPHRSADPRIARALRCNYDEETFVKGKRENKTAFQEALGLVPNPEAPLFFWPHRLYDQKGPHLLEQIAYSLLNEYASQGLQLAVIGNGDTAYEEAFAVLSLGSGGRMVYRNFDAELSELGKAASDFILMPSLYEPCGLPQMEGMRYGTLPIVRATGGLKDTVLHLDIENDRGNGFVFNDFTPDALWWGCTEAMNFYSQPAAVREKIVRRVMRDSTEEFNLEKTTLQYVRIYEKLCGEKLL